MNERTTVNDDQLWERLQFCESLGALGALSDFGNLLVNEGLSRTAALDSKGTNLLGWNSAASAVLSAAIWRLDDVGALSWLLMFGALLSSAGTICAFMAVRNRDFEVPSQVEWLPLDFICAPPKPDETKKPNDDEEAIRRRHIAAMLRWHRSDRRENAIKALWVTWSFRCLVGAGLILPIAVLLNTAVERN